MANEHIKIGDVTPWVQYAGNGSQTQFDFTFPIFENDDLEVYLGPSATPEAGGYTVAGAGDSDGGTVSFDTAPGAGVAVTILRNVAIKRVTDFTESGDFRASVINTELDRLTAVAQQLSNAVTRAVRLADTDAAGSVQLPAVGARANRIAAFDASGDLVAVELAATELLVSALMEGFLALDTTVAARGAIGAQAQSGDLDAIAALTPNDGDILQRAGGAWTAAPAAAVETADIGDIKQTARKAADIPAGWLLCDGSTIGDVGSGATHEHADYETLFDYIKGLYGAGETGAEDFAAGNLVALPDLRGRSLLGVNDAGLPNGESGSYSTRNEGDTGGEEAHVLTEAELASHSHTFTNHTSSSSNNFGTGGQSAVTSVSGLTSNTGPTGSDAAHNNMQPFLAVNFIIKF